MKTITTIAAIRAELANKRKDRRVALVPTMGNLHAGHMRLVEMARRTADLTVVSIYVNPLQFAPSEDFASYPRTLDADHELLREAGVDCVFQPDDEEMYPNGQTQHTRVTVPHIANQLCGEFRPGHFDGVSTVVTKLLRIIEPEVALFGEKDYQQLLLIRALVADLHLHADIVGVPTVRADDGLALSSRNTYLSDTERAAAPILHQTLQDVAHALTSGATNYAKLENTARIALKGGGFHTEYVSIREADTLALPTPDTRHFRVLAAARLGGARLIDNLGVSV